MKKIVMANDHAAVEIKEELKAWLLDNGFEVNDLGVDEDGKADYPDQAEAACKEFLRGGYHAGVICCGTGIGISISANKIKGIRCALPQNIFAASMAREHNNCQFIAFGGRIEYCESPVEMLAAYLGVEFDGGERHQRRIDKIMELEK